MPKIVSIASLDEKSAVAEVSNAQPEETVNKEEPMETKSNNIADVLKKLSALEWLGISEYFTKKAEVEPKPEDAIIPQVAPEMPKEASPEPMTSTAKDEDKSTEEKKDMDIKDIEKEQIKDLKDVNTSIEKFMKDCECSEDVKKFLNKIKDSVNKIEKSEKAEEKHEDKKPEVKPEEKKEDKKPEVKPEVKPEMPKPEMPKMEAPKAEPKPMEAKKPMPFKPASYKCTFTVSDPIGKSAWLVVNKETNEPYLEADLETLFGKNASANFDTAKQPEFIKHILANVTAKGLTKAAVFEAIAHYSPCYPSHKQFQAPVKSEHPKAKELPPVETDKVLDAKKTDAAVVAPVTKVASDLGETDKACGATEGSQVKIQEHNNPEQSSHPKSKTEVKSETDASVDPKKTAESESLLKLKAENEALNKKLAEINMQHMLAKKKASCENLIEVMAQKNLIKADSAAYKEAITSGKSMEESQKVAVVKSINNEVKSMLAMDDASFKAYAEKIASIDKVASVTDTVLKTPIHVNASTANTSDVLAVADLINNFRVESEK